MAVNGINTNKTDGATNVVNETENEHVDTVAIADQVRKEVDVELGASPTYEYEFAATDPIEIARAIKLELLDGLTKAIFDGDITKLDFALYVARTELAKNPKHYIRLAFIDGMGYKNIMLNPTEENLLKVKEDFRLVAESDDPTEIGCNFDLEYLKELSDELIVAKAISKPNDNPKVSNIINEAKASAEETAKQYEETTATIVDKIEMNEKESNNSSSGSSRSSSSFWESDVVSVVATVAVIGAVAYAAYKAHDYFAGDGDIVIIDNDIGAFDMGF